MHAKMLLACGSVVLFCLPISFRPYGAKTDRQNNRIGGLRRFLARYWNLRAQRRANVVRQATHNLGAQLADIGVT
jgi:hypothetical protein